MMMHRTLLLLPLLCVEATVLKRRIHRIVENKNWFDAQAYCRQHYTDLLTIRNQPDNDQITHDGWIGLHRVSDNSEWKWSNGDLDGNFYWRSGESDQTNQNCAYNVEGYAEWYSRDCLNLYPFYCMEVFILVEQETQWEEALEHCRNLDPTVDGNHRYDLASPFTLGNVYTQDIFQSSPNKVWIGLRYLGDQWSWLNGQYYDDNLDCPYVNRCGTLENNVIITVEKRRCDEPLYFLCARRK